MTKQRKCAISLRYVAGVLRARRSPANPKGKSSTLENTDTLRASGNIGDKNSEECGKAAALGHNTICHPKSSVDARRVRVRPSSRVRVVTALRGRDMRVASCAQTNRVGTALPEPAISEYLSPVSQQRDRASNTTDPREQSRCRCRANFPAVWALIAATPHSPNCMTSVNPSTARVNVSGQPLLELFRHRGTGITTRPAVARLFAPELLRTAVTFNL